MKSSPGNGSLEFSTGLGDPKNTGVSKSGTELAQKSLRPGLAG